MRREQLCIIRESGREFEALAFLDFEPPPAWTSYAQHMIIAGIA
jgi:hypothetical protein